MNVQIQSPAAFTPCTLEREPGGGQDLLVFRGLENKMSVSCSSAQSKLIWWNIIARYPSLGHIPKSFKPAVIKPDCMCFSCVFIRAAKRLDPRQARWALFFSRLQYSLQVVPHRREALLKDKGSGSRLGTSSSRVKSSAPNT